MTSVQIGQALLIAVLTAFATTVLNNFAELYRLRRMWAHEMGERKAYHRMQQLQERLSAVRAFIDETFRVTADMTIWIAYGAPSGGFADMGRRLLGESGRAHAAAQVVGDEQLTARLQELFDSVRDLTMISFVDTETEEWTSQLTDLTNRAAVALARCDELLREANLEALSYE